MSAGRCHDGDAGLTQSLHDVASRQQAVIEVVLIERFAKPDCNGLEIPSGETTVGREALCHDQDITFLESQLRIIGAEEAPDIPERVLFRRHRAAVGIAEHLAGDIDRRGILETLFTVFYEVGIFREATGIDVKRNAGRPGYAADVANIGHRNGLPTTRIVRNRHHDDGNAFRAVLGDEFLECLDIHVALERVIGVEITCFGTGQVDRRTSNELDVAARRVEVGVVRHDGVGFDHDPEQDVFRCPALMRWNDLLESEYVFHGVAKTVPAARPGVGLVAAHHGSPGFGGHGAGAGVRQQIDYDVFGT